MSTGRHLLSRAGLALLVASATLGSLPAAAADKPTRSRCAYGIATDGSSNCMSKADFDVARSRQEALDRDPAQYKRNAIARCEGLTGADRQDCLARIDGKGTTSGSVEGGGIYRELVTREVEAPAAPAALDTAPAADPKK